MSMVVGPAGSTGEGALPAATRGYLSRYADPESVGTDEGIDQQATDATGPAAQTAGSSPVPSSVPSPATLPPAAERSRAEGAMMDRFLDDYLRLIFGRVDVIERYISEIRYEEARVAILSLESASGMVGEAALRTMLHDLRLSVDVCGDEGRERQLAAIRAESKLVHHRLAAA